MRSVSDRAGYESDPARVIAAEVHAGDRVKVTTTDGVTQTFEVVRVADEKLVGAGCDGCAVVDVRFDDIEELFVEKVSATKTAGIGSGMAVAIVVVVALIAGPTFSPGL